MCSVVANVGATMKRKRSKIVRNTIREIWASLDSHLPACHAKGLKKPEGNKFHKKCVKEYARLIVLLTKLY